MDLIVYETFILLLAAGLVSIAFPFATERRLGPLVAFVAVAVIQAAVLTIPLALGWRVGHWNWIGKLASIVTGLAVLPVLRLTRREVGLVLPRGRSGWGRSLLGLSVGLLFVSVFVLVLGPNPRPSVETIAYQATMPGLDEELAFRGIFMALLARGYPAVRFGLPVWTLPVVITTLHFTMGHVVTIEHGHLGLAIAAATFVLPFGLLLALIRVGSSSLLGSVVTHNAVNVAGYIAAAGRGTMTGSPAGSRTFTSGRC